MQPIWKGYSSLLDCNIAIAVLDVEAPDTDAAVIGIGATFSVASDSTREIASITMRVREDIALKTIESGSFVQELETIYIQGLSEALREWRETNELN